MESLNTEQRDVAPVGNVLLLLQGEQGQVLKGSSLSILWQMEICQGCITTTCPGVQFHICSSGWAAVSSYYSLSISHPAFADVFSGVVGIFYSHKWWFAAAEIDGKKMYVIKMCGWKNEIYEDSWLLSLNYYQRMLTQESSDRCFRLVPDWNISLLWRYVFFPEDPSLPPNNIFYFSDIFPTCCVNCKN